MNDGEEIYFEGIFNGTFLPFILLGEMKFKNVIKIIIDIFRIMHDL
jgi:hypothetical protein